MVFKLNISEKGKAWKLETESEFMVGKNVGDKVDGKDVKSELDGYELEITGGSDIAGFPLSKDVEGLGLKKVLLKKGWGMHDNREGVRLRKTVRGRQISVAVSQINLKVVKAGKKALSEVFSDQNKEKAVEPAKKEVKAEAEVQAVSPAA